MTAVPNTRHTLVPYRQFEQLREAKDILCREADALRDVASRLDVRFCEAVELLLHCRGRVIVTGMGKAGLVGQKIAATLSSTGTKAQFLHPAEAVHGDLGCLCAEDVVLALSNSGETEEVCRLLPLFERIGAPVVAVTSSETSSLAVHAKATICLGRLQEVGIHGLAPSTTTTAMLAVGDALALVAARQRGLTPELFAVVHPAGTLGRKLMRVRDMMRRGPDVRIASQLATVREVFTTLARPGRRSGAIILVDEQQQVRGLFTDSDLARLMERRSDNQFDRPIRDVMTCHPVTVLEDDTLGQVVDMLAGRKFSELPVVNARDEPVGLIDITDVIGLLPAAEESASNSVRHER
ncbi:MAG: KpsF/GutQ family sugar-phosphate isomerase [Planctomycetaceae bacterium]|nr:KpsF/GutQ family sugar-phosphate isomerase [Planctomycetaceae bacterium]